MTAHTHSDLLPRGALVAAGSLVLFAFAVTATVRIAHIRPAASPSDIRAAAHVELAAARNLRFIDRNDGAVIIEDADKGDTASVIEPGQQTGFIRGVMRGLARERRMRGIGDGPAFKLELWRDGQLSLTDTATGRSVELTAFGSSNRAAFVALLPKGAGS